MIGRCRGARSSPASAARTARCSPSSCSAEGYEVLGVVRRPGSSYPNLDGIRDRDRADPGRSQRPGLARAARCTPAAPRGGLQPRVGLVRADVVGAAGADGRARGGRRDRAARGDPRGRRVDPLLPGVVVGDLRRAGRVAAGRVHAAESADAVRRREGLRALHHAQLSPALRDARLVRDPLQPHLAAAAGRVPAAQGRRTPPPRSASGCRTSSGSATCRRVATGASPATTCAASG